LLPALCWALLLLDSPERALFPLVDALELLLLDVEPSVVDVDDC
jgi:hypothetical protein